MGRSQNKKIFQRIKTNYMLILGALIAALYWIFDDAIMTIVSREGDLTAQALAPDIMWTWHRIFTVGLMIVFAIYANNMIRKDRQTEAELRESEERYRRLVELSPDAIGIQCEDEIVFMNSAGTSLFGAKDSGQLMGKSVWDFVPPEYREIVDDRFRQMREKGSEVPLIELKLNTLNGELIDAEVTAIPFLLEGKPAIHAIFRDISQRKQVEEEIRHRNIELSALNAIAGTVSQSLDLNLILNNALDDVIRLDVLGGDAQGMLFLWDQRTNDISLVTQRGAPEDHPCLSQPPELGECLCGLAIQTGETITSENALEDERHTRTWPDMPQHSDACIPLKVRGRVLGCMMVRLVAEKKITPSKVELLTSVADQISVALENARLFEAVDRQRDKLRNLGARLAEAQEVERKQLSRELHDQVGQNLTALGINLNIVKSQLPEVGAEMARSTLDESLNLVEQTTVRIRDVMAELRPPMLDDYGLVATLRWFGSQFSSRIGIPINVYGEELASRPTANEENALFRITTEALTNIAKHAQATQATVALEVEGNTLRLTIADDGTGFDYHRLSEPSEDRGWGLLTMTERVEAVGGRFWIESDPSKGGTRVVAEIDR